MLMQSLIINNLFSGYKMGRYDPVTVSHLQFADDTLIVGENRGLIFGQCKQFLFFFKTCLV